ncbi:MAG: ParB/RepB/Spo0J family partition protein [Pseudolysinimonas sp.]|uniref:ParB/RepB/Spo0J family partition protein n=1 Tax=Pseudolysinimonas sp. TaxID=2680009 RepID=UPI0032630A46
MTDTTTLGTVEHIDPNTIEVETNIRTVSKPDPALVASIRQFGVLEPVVCRRDENGNVTVRMGQRRVLAAREAGSDTIPAYIVAGDDATTTRLLEQFAENEHRADLTQAERAAVFQQLQFEGLSNGGQVGGMTDEQKAERRELIANNKAWDSAEAVRREWLATFLSRKTLPKDAPAFLTVGLTQHRRDVASALSGGNRLAATLLGLEPQSSEWQPSPVDGYAEQHGKAGHVALAIVLAGMEAAIGRHTWRNPSSTAGRYLAQIEAWGYALSEVEQIVTAAKVTPGDEFDAEPESDDEGEDVED